LVIGFSFIMAIPRDETYSIVIVDDQDGDPVTGNKIVYSPADAWALGAIGGCPKCAVPSSGIAYRGSFHGSLFVRLLEPFIHPRP
jgi:hypothetical protein